MRYAACAAALLMVTSCGGATSGDAPGTNGGTISNVAPTPPSAFQQVDLQQGTGALAARGAHVTVKYTGWIYDSSKPDNKGTRFDSSDDHGPFDFPLGAGQVIPGWDQGLVGMRVGGKRRLIIPPDLGYGAQGTPGGPIPPNAGLVFDVELTAIK